MQFSNPLCDVMTGYSSAEFGKYCSHRDTPARKRSGIHTAMADRRRDNWVRQSSTGTATVQLLMNRSVRTLLPGLTELLDPGQDKRARWRDRQWKEYNKEYRERRHKDKEKQV